MKIIHRGRGQGKTTELIKIAAENDYYIAVATKQEASRVFQAAREMGLDIHFPVTYHEFRIATFGLANIKGFVLDNADMFLQSFFFGRLEAITITGEIDR